MHSLSEGGATVPLVCLWSIYLDKPIVPLMYHLFMMVYLTGVCIWLAVYLDSADKFFSFLSNWSTIVASIYSIVCFIHHALSFARIESIHSSLFKEQSDSDLAKFEAIFKRYLLTLRKEYQQNEGPSDGWVTGFMPPSYDDRNVITIGDNCPMQSILFEKIVIVLQNMTVTLLLAVVLTYWTTSASLASFQFLNLQYHGGTFICVLIDFALCCNPSSWKVFWQAYIICFVYWLFTIIDYFGFGGEQVYPFTDWSNGYSIPIVFIGSFFMFLFCNWAVVQLKKKRMKKNLSQDASGSGKDTDTDNDTGNATNTDKNSLKNGTKAEEVHGTDSDNNASNNTSNNGTNNNSSDNITNNDNMADNDTRMAGNSSNSANNENRNEDVSREVLPSTTNGNLSQGQYHYPPSVSPVGSGSARSDMIESQTQTQTQQRPSHKFMNSVDNTSNNNNSTMDATVTEMDADELDALVAGADADGDGDEESKTLNNLTSALADNHSNSSKLNVKKSSSSNIQSHINLSMGTNNTYTTNTDTNDTGISNTNTNTPNNNNSVNFGNYSTLKKDSSATATATATATNTAVTSQAMENNSMIISVETMSVAGDELS